MYMTIDTSSYLMFLILTLLLRKGCNLHERNSNKLHSTEAWMSNNTLSGNEWLTNDCIMFGLFWRMLRTHPGTSMRLNWRHSLVKMSTAWYVPVRPKPALQLKHVFMKMSKGSLNEALCVSRSYKTRVITTCLIYIHVCPLLLTFT